MRLTLYLLLGIIISLGGSWFSINLFENRYRNGWFRVFGGPYTYNGTIAPSTGWLIGEPNADGDFWIIAGYRNIDGRIFQIRHEIPSRGLQGIERRYEPGDVPSWTRVPDIPRAEDAASDARIIEQYNGWPFLAWRGEARLDRRSYAGQYRWCIPSDRGTGRVVWDQLVLFPFEPVFPGVLLNAAFFGGALFCVLYAIRRTLRSARGAIRRSNKQCVRCKYSVVGLETCPECGEPVIRKSASEHA